MTSINNNSYISKKYRTIDPELLDIIGQSDQKLDQLLGNISTTQDTKSKPRPLPLISKRLLKKDLITINAELKNSVKITTNLPRLSLKSVEDSQSSPRPVVVDSRLEKLVERKKRMGSIYSSKSRSKTLDYLNSSIPMQSQSMNIVQKKKFNNLDVYSLELQKLMVSRTEIGSIKQEQAKVRELKKSYKYLQSFPEQWFKEDNKLLVAML